MITISVPSCKSKLDQYQFDNVTVVVVVVVVVVLTSPGPGDAPDVAHERLVKRPRVSMMDLPATVTEVVEANSLPAEVRALLDGTHAAQSILQLRVNLHNLNSRISLKKSSLT